MKWFLTPDNIEFSQWSPRAFSKHTRSLVKAIEPDTAEELADGQMLYPLTDNGPTIPEGQVVDARTVTVAGGVATAGYTYTTMPLADRKASMKAAVSALLAAKLTGGYTHDFGGSHGEKVLQTRDTDDQVNWLTSQAAYSAAIAGGAGATMGANFRTEDNVIITLSYSDGLAVLLAMAAWGQSLYANSWTLKDAIESASDHDDLDAIDINSGW